MLRLERLYPVIALSAFAALSIWLERITRVEEPVTIQAMHNDPDFIAEQTRIVSFDADGELRYELHAAQLSHFPLTDMTHLLEPRLLMRNDEDRETHVRAHRAEVSPGGEQIELYDDVRVDRPAVDTEPALSLVSAALTIWPDAHRARSDLPVILRRDASQATALAMRADNLFGEFELIGDVRVTMPPREGSHR